MKVKWCPLFLFASAFLLLQGCASRPVYESLKEIERQHCYQMEDPTERQECLEKTNEVSYDQYQKIRENQKIQSVEEE